MALKLMLLPIILVISTITMILFPTTHSLPFVVFHGIAEPCSNKEVEEFTDFLTKRSRVQGYCIEIGNGFMDSFFMPLLKQTEIACEKVKKMKELSQGYNIVARSQGNMVARGVIEFCDAGPPVKNYISVAGPQAGIASIPLCGFPTVCNIVSNILKFGIYSTYVQENLAPAGYIKIPTDIVNYLEGSQFLPKLNNEIAGLGNSTYKKRFARLQNLVLIMCEQDKVLVPKETSWFGYYEQGSAKTVLPVEKTKLYKEDWIGLKSLNEAGKVQFVKVAGGHLQISRLDMWNYVLPYLMDNKLQLAIPESYRKQSFSSTSLNKKLAEFAEELELAAE